MTGKRRDGTARETGKPKPLGKVKLGALGGMMGNDPLAWLNEEPEADDSVRGVLVPAERLAKEEGEERQSGRLLRPEQADPEGSEVTGGSTDPSFGKEEGGEKNMVVLDARLGIESVAELRNAWLSRLRCGSGWRIDGSSVLHVDCAGLQLLLSLQRTLQSRGECIQWEGFSEALLLGARTLGLSEDLGMC